MSSDSASYKSALIIAPFHLLPPSSSVQYMYFLYFVIDFFIVNNRNFILFSHSMAEILIQLASNPAEKKWKNIFLPKNKWKKYFSTCFAKKQVEKIFFHLFSARRTCTLLHKLSASGLVRLAEKYFFHLFPAGFEAESI